MRQCFNDLVIIWCGCGFHGYARYKNAGRRRERERRKETRRGTGMGNSSCVLDSMGGILNTTIVQAHVWGPTTEICVLLRRCGHKNCFTWIYVWAAVFKRFREEDAVLFFLLVSSSCRLLRWQLPCVAHGVKVKETRQATLNLEVNVNCEHPAPQLSLYGNLSDRWRDKLLLLLLVNKLPPSLVVTCFWCADITSCVAADMWKGGGGRRSLLMLPTRDTQSAAKPN